MFKSIVICLAFACAFASLAVDFDVYQHSVDPDAFTCLWKINVTSVAMQYWDGSGVVNPFFQGNYLNAKGIGIRRVDAIATVCNNGSTPEAVCNGIMDNIPGGFDGMVWLDLQPARGCWTDNMGERIPFVENVVRTCENFGLEVGIYSNVHSWTVLMGNQYTTSGFLTNYPVWYVGTDSQPGYADFSTNARFGGWSNPSMKMYLSSQALCGITVNYDYY